eukprot:5928951-Pyramimonas_sp.AAC.2
MDAPSKGYVAKGTSPAPAPPECTYAEANKRAADLSDPERTRYVGNFPHCHRNKGGGAAHRDGARGLECLNLAAEPGVLAGPEHRQPPPHRRLAASD